MINEIETAVIWTTPDDDFSAFLPRCCVVPSEHGRTLLMTVQEITASDHFLDVHWSLSHDDGHAWSRPAGLPGMEWRDIDGGINEMICDVLPTYHPQTGTVLAIGHNGYLKDGKFLDTYGTWDKDNVGYQRRLKRFPVYTVRNADGEWTGARKQLVVPDLLHSKCYTCGSAQRITLGNGNLLMPFSFGVWDRSDHQVCSAEFSFDGNEPVFVQRGNELMLPEGRGLLEPQMTCFDDHYFLSLRAEDGHGYVSTSTDGMNWAPIRQWQWENGDALAMSTTQQHWLEINGKLHLVYTRETEHNKNVMRWRSPLLIAEVDTDNCCLRRDTERTVFPMDGDGIDNAEGVSLMGNFLPLALDRDLAVVVVGAWHRPTYQTRALIAWLR